MALRIELEPAFDILGSVTYGRLSHRAAGSHVPGAVSRLRLECPHRCC
jgi:hypothetical protein